MDVGLCLPMDLMPAFVVGAPTGEVGKGQQTLTPWGGNSGKRRGGPVSPANSSKSVPGHVSMAGPMAEASRAGRSLPWLPLKGSLEWQDLISKTVVAVNLWSQNTHPMKIHVHLAKGKA